MNDKKISVKANFIYNLLYQVISILAPMIIASYVSHVLGAKRVGIYSVVNANVECFIMLGVFGLSTYSQFEVSKKRDNKNELNQFCFESFITRCTTIGVSLVLYFIFLAINGGDYRLYYILMLPLFLANLFDFSWVCQGLENFKSVTIIYFCVKILSVILVFLFIQTTDDLIWYIVINSAAVFLSNILIFIRVMNMVKFCLYRKIRVFYHIKKSLFYFLPSIASSIIYVGDKIMLGWMVPDRCQSGYYEQAVNIECMIFMVFASLNLTMRPRLSYLYEKGKKSEIHEYLKYSLSITILFALPAFIGLALISDIFVPLFFGEDFIKLTPILIIMSACLFVKAVSNCLLEQSIVAKGKMKIGTFIIWVGAVTNVLLNLFMIPKMLAVGAALSSLVTEIIILVLVYVFTRKERVVDYIVNSIKKELIAAFFMASLICLIKYVLNDLLLEIILSVFLGGVLYFILLILLKDSCVNSIILNLKSLIMKSGD
ncbi:Membrane protein involved in the export of O-antigen and teichoic acid [Lachnospiraceae bacterium NE2001]|nr:Membrane protein involved in the export of O-antigen and teichoic acid [Lachnospiraceae bacterium NE2001]